VLATALIDVATPSPSEIVITYAAHTSSCSFLLDSDGICRRIVLAPKGKRSASRTAARCVGAQYVASLDGSAAGGLVEMPRVGAAMLFARVDERGRVSLVRTGTVTAFESHANEDPFVDPGTVETSAPDLLTPRAAPAPTQRSSFDDPVDPDYYDDPSQRTQRIQALRPQDIARALGELGTEQGNDLATAEYRAAVDDQAASRATTPSSANVPTLRNPHRETTLDDEDDDYARPAPAPRGVLPRRSDPHVRAAAARAWAPDPRPTPRAYASDVQVSRRRRTP
jgi:hypothetical protein